MKVQASLPNLRISPRKTRLVTRALVGTSVDEALLQLRKQTKKASTPLAALLESAAANALHNLKLNREDLFIQEIRVGDGQRLKRWLPRAFGRATPLVRRGSNVTVILSTRGAAPEKQVKTEAKKEKVSEKEAVKKPAAKKVAKKKVATKKS